VFGDDDGAAGLDLADAFAQRRFQFPDTDSFSRMPLRAHKTRCRHNAADHDGSCRCDPIGQQRARVPWAGSMFTGLDILRDRHSLAHQRPNAAGFRRTNPSDLPQIVCISREDAFDGSEVIEQPACESWSDAGQCLYQEQAP
jgi:hypothetical protein